MDSSHQPWAVRWPAEVLQSIIITACHGLQRWFGVFEGGMSLLKHRASLGLDQTLKRDIVRELLFLFATHFAPD